MLFLLHWVDLGRFTGAVGWREAGTAGLIFWTHRLAPFWQGLPGQPAEVFQPSHVPGALIQVTKALYSNFLICTRESAQ